MLHIEHVTKRFGTTTAVDDVTLSIRPGEIVGLVGENGAGKTTLMRIVAGELAADSGNVTTPHVAIVHQHFALVPQFTIAENLALTTDRSLRVLNRSILVRDAERIIGSTGIALSDVSRFADDLSVGEKSKLELIKAVAAQPELLILDEPTSVLTPFETEELFGVIRELSKQGTAVVFISHKVPEVVAVADRVVVMREGRVVADATNMTAEQIANAMVLSGGQAPRLSRAKGQARAPVLHLESLSADILKNVSFQLHAGETIALVGVAGNGQTELIEILRGLKKPRGGRVEAATTRVGFIPEDRTRDALVADMTIAENIALGTDRWNPGDAARRAEHLIDLYRVRARGPAQRAGQLSGGNQQKVVLARELDRKPELIIAAEPTRGLDIEATRFVHEQLLAAVDAGAALLLITSDLDEAFALADALHVIYRGRLSERLMPDQASSRIGQLMAGVE